MDRLVAMQVFVKVAETGSFTRAADELRLSRAMVSRHVQDLESYLGARLLNRTTRSVSLTEGGRVYHERAVQLLTDLEEAEQAVSHLQAEPRGTLRLNAPMSFGALHLAPAIADFTSLHPDVSIDLTLNDRVVDVVEEGYDLAIRISRLPDSSLIARRLAPSPLILCAAPAYVERHGAPAHPSDLTAHNCLGYSYWALRDEWRFEGPEGTASVRIRGNLQANNGDALRAAAIAGQGIVILPSFLIGPDLQAGRLVSLLPGYTLPELGIYAVYPHARHLSAKVRSFVDFLVARFGGRPAWDAGRDDGAEPQG